MRVKEFFSSEFTWDWRSAALLGICAVPAVALSFFAPARLATAAVIGLIPAAFNGLAPTRKKRAAVLGTGAMVSAALFVGSMIKAHLSAGWAAIVMALLGAAITLLAGKYRFARVGAALAVPVVGIGLSYDSARVPLEVLALMMAGALLAWLVSLPFPEYEEPARLFPRSLVPKRKHYEPLPLHVALYALALATGTLLGYGWDHTGWVVGSIALVMRPLQEMLEFRSAWRIAAVLLGAAAASVVLILHPPAFLAVALAGLAMAAAGGLHRSEAYILPAFMTYAIFTFMLYPAEDGAEVWLRFAERVGWVAVGIGIACLFGIVIPRIFVQEPRDEAAPPAPPAG